LKKINTHEELMLLLITSVETLIKDIKDKNQELKDRDDYEDGTQLHYTLRIIQKWFFNNGNMPV